MNSQQNTTVQPKEILLDSFNFFDCKLESVSAKIRPYREGGVRLQYENIKDKHIFHNYGHGSCGVSLAFGSAYMSLKQLSVYIKQDDIYKCSVIGGGLIGLMTAIELSKRGYNVTLYSKHSLETKSQKSQTQMNDGLWLPLGYDFSSSKLTYQLFSKISYEYYLDCRKKSIYQSIQVANIYDRDRTIKELKNLIPPFLYNGYKKVDINFKTGLQQNYTKFKTFQIDMQTFIEELKIEAHLRGVKFVQKHFKSLDEILNLEDNIIFNCTGFESKRLFGDEKVKSYVDHIILFKNPQKMNCTIITKLKDDLQLRIHCQEDKILIRNEHLVDAEDIDNTLVQKMIEETANFFNQRSSSMQAKL